MRAKQDEELGLLLAEISGETLFPSREQLLTVAQTCRAFQICRRTLHKWTEEDQILPSVKIGHSKRYRLADVLALIEQFRRRAIRKASSQISAFDKFMKSRVTKAAPGGTAREISAGASPAVKYGAFYSRRRGCANPL